MSYFPQRCQHIKVNGTQCGCPALRQHKLCYFHQHHHDERVELNTARARRSRRSAAIVIDLPVLEDANSIQVSLSQVIRLVLTRQIDAKSAGLALYALQTASANLPRTNFEPLRWDVVVDPTTVARTPLGTSVWREDDFITEEQKRARAEAAARRQAEQIAEARRRIEAEADRLSLEGQLRNAAEARAQAAAKARAEAAAAEERKQRQEAGKGREVAKDEPPTTNDGLPSNTQQRSPSQLIAAMKSLIKDLPPQPTTTTASAPQAPPRIPPAPAKAHVSLAKVRQRIAEGEFT